MFFCAQCHTLETGKPHAEARATLEGHHGAVNCVAAGADGETFVTGGADGTVRAWALDADAAADALAGTSEGVEGKAAAHDGSLRCFHVLWGHDAPVTSLALDVGLDLVVSGCSGGTIAVHTLRTGTMSPWLFHPLSAKPHTPNPGTMVFQENSSGYSASSQVPISRLAG